MPLKDHSAPGPAAGFIYQFERAMFWLAQSPAGFIIGIETDDDVAIRGNGQRLLEQNKHSVRDGGMPFGDRSRDLWNTLAIWIEALDNGEVKAETTRFLMVTNKELPDCIARQIGLAEKEDQIIGCISKLNAAASLPRPKHVATLMERVLRSKSNASLKNLIKRCELIDASNGSAGAELRKRTIGHLQLPTWCLGQADSIIDELLGWLYGTALAAWQQNQPAWVKRDHFVNRLFAIIDRRKRQINRERAANLIPVPDDTIGQEKGSIYVKQIYLITDDDDVINDAIREFVRCNIEKDRLSKEGNVTDEDWIAFEFNLHERWKKIFRRVIRMSRGQRDQQEQDVGYEIFIETTEDHREQLAGVETEQVYLTAGTYHRLADLIRVGWHPRFRELLRHEGKA